MQPSVPTKRSSLHFKDVEEMIRAEEKKNPQVTLRNGLLQITEAVGMAILQNFSLEQIEKLERECKENPPELENLNGLIIFGLALGMIDGCLSFEKRNLLKFENIRRLCEEGKLDLALHYARELSPENDIRDAAYKLLIRAHMQKGEEMAALLTRELQKGVVLLLYKDCVSNMAHDLAIFKNYHHVAEIMRGHLNKLSLEALEDLVEQSNAHTGCILLSKEQLKLLAIFDQETQYTEDSSYEGLTDGVLFPFALQRELQRVNELLDEDNVEGALDLARSLNREQNVTLDAYADIVEYLKEIGEDKRALAVAQEMPDGDQEFKEEVITSIHTVKSKRK